MKVLICCSNREEVAHFLNSLNGYKIELDKELIHINHPKKLIIESYSRDEMNIDIAIIGNTSVESSFHVGRILNSKNYHLALMIGFCSSFSDYAQNGELVNIINEKSGDIECSDETNIQNLYQMGLLDSNEFPHLRGGFINMTNSYFDVFLNIKKVAGITSSISYKKMNALVQRRIDVDKVTVETRNGLGFVYACLWNQQAFYQLRYVDYEIFSQKKSENSMEKLAENIIQILDLMK